MRNFLFITTSSLASNPRLVKEFEALKKEFSCQVLCFKHEDWSLEGSEGIKKRNPEVQFFEIDRKKEAFQTIICKVIHKTAILLNSSFPTHFKICAFASNDKALQLWLRAQELQKKTQFSRVIAHNLGAFYAAVKLSEKKDIALQLDIEDYYPGEALYFNKALEKQNRTELMAHGFLRADSITYASIGIQLECEQHFEVRSETAQVTVINSFKSTDFREPEANLVEKVKCVWFSQHIGPNRGLEQVFEAAKELDQIEFHVVGNLNRKFLDDVTLSENILLHDIMEQSKLHVFLATMDVGLALEPGKDLNNLIALSNKIITYAQAGLYILATDTFGQSQFLNSIDYNAGIIMRSTLVETLQNLDNKLLNTATKIGRWQNAKAFSWENEQVILKTLLS